MRASEDIDEQTLSASEFKAIATGNPYLKLKMELDNEFELFLIVGRLGNVIFLCLKNVLSKPLKIRKITRRNFLY